MKLTVLLVSVLFSLGVLADSDFARVKDLPNRLTKAEAEELERILEEKNRIRVKENQENSGAIHPINQYKVTIQSLSRCYPLIEEDIVVYVVSLFMDSSLLDFENDILYRSFNSGSTRQINACLNAARFCLKHNVDKNLVSKAMLPPERSEYRGMNE